MKTILSLCTVLISSLAFGQVQPVCFNTPISTNSLNAGPNLAFVISADLNGDGNMDLVASDYAAFTNSITVFLGSGTGTFAAGVSYPTTGSGPKGLVAKDFNGDGKLDIAVCNAYSTSISIFPGSGTGAFATATNYSIGTSPFSLASADFNNDGLPDLAAGGYQTAQFSLLLSSGPGTFSTSVDFTTSASVGQITTGDFNQDGNADIALTNNSSNNIYIYSGSGTGGFATPVSYTTGTGPFAITSADFNNDGFTDLAVTNFAGIAILTGSGGGLFSSGAIIPELNSWTGITTSDFNNDGNTDLAVSNGAASVQVMLGMGTGSFVAPLSFAVPNPYSLVSADLNNDLKPDLIIASTSNSVITLINGTFSPSLSPVPPPACAGTSVVLSASGGNTYTWSTGATTFSDAVAPVNTTGYAVTVGSLLGCTIELVAIVHVIPGPTITVNSGTICEGQNFTLIPNGGLNYSYQGGSAVVSPSVTGNYTVAGSNTVGCVSYATSTITVNPLPIITASSGSICEGQSFFIIAGGNAVTYTFSGGTSIVSPTSTTSYSVSGTSNKGCISALPTISTITVIPLPIVTVNSGSVCSGQTFTIIAAGANSYAYEGGSDLVIPTTNTTYTVTGTSMDGCVSLPATCNVVVAALPVISVNSGSICNGQNFTITPSGAGNYTFSGGSGIVSPTINTSYIVTGMDAAGCISDSSAICQVSVYQTPQLQAGSIKTICAGESANLTVSGAPSYTWSTGSNGHAVIVSPAVTTTYTVTGTNIVGCTASISITQVVDQCLGLNELSNSDANFEIHLYPNPSQGDLNVDVTRESDIVLVNTLGKVVQTRHLEAGRNTMDLREQAAGVYLLYVKQGGSGKALLIVKD